MYKKVLQANLFWNIEHNPKPTIDTKYHIKKYGKQICPRILKGK